MLPRANCVRVANDKRLPGINGAQKIWHKTVERPVATADDIASASASGLRQTDCILFSLALARVTFARMSEAFAVQMNGFG